MARNICLFVTVLACCCQSLLAQATFGSIFGTVTDPAGSAVPETKVTITSLDRGTQYTASTNDAGNYNQTHLPSGL